MIDFEPVFDVASFYFLWRSCTLYRVGARMHSLFSRLSNSGSVIMTWQFWWVLAFKAFCFSRYEAKLTQSQSQPWHHHGISEACWTMVSHFLGICLVRSSHSIVRSFQKNWVISLPLDLSTIWSTLINSKIKDAKVLYPMVVCFVLQSVWLWRMLDLKASTRPSCQRN